MIAHFPDPYPGELLYSMLARFCERMQYPTHTNTLLELFGSRHAVPAVELPHRIDRLVSLLPPGTRYTSDYLIQKHTLLPFYAPFLPERSHNIIVENMKGNGIRTTQLVAGIIAGRVPPPEFFKSCPLCDRENVTRYGETYWNRLHQIRGVEVCPLHQVFLEPSNIRIRNLDDRHELFTATQAQLRTAAVPVKPNKPAHQVLLRVAQSAAWLLDENTARPGLTRINELHRDVLREYGCVTNKEKIRLRNIFERMESHCTPALLDILMCPLKIGVDGGWVGRLFRTTNKVIAPLKHLLVLAAFQVTAQSFFTRQLCSRAARGPYPCVNPACPEHRALTIETFESKREKYGVAYIFECPKCGHRSSRTEEGKSVVRVVNLGPVWNERLKSLWMENSRSTASLATELGVHFRTLKNQAVKIGLPFPRIANRTTCADQTRPPKPLTDPKLVLAAKRDEWEQLKRANPTISKKELRKQAPALFAWLYRNDRGWLNCSSPPPQPKIRTYVKIDWNARDEELAGKVMTAAIRIRNNPDYPRRITIREIGRVIGQRAVLEIHLDKLPYTRLSLKDHTETTEQFALRRIRWTRDAFIMKRRLATGSQIGRAAGISPTVGKHPSVQQALADAEERISQWLMAVPAHAQMLA